MGPRPWCESGKELFRADHVAVRVVSTTEGSMNKAITCLPPAGIGQNEHGEHGPTATRLAADPHLTRLALDHIEWYDRLVRLAELRKGGQ